MKINITIGRIEFERGSKQAKEAKAIFQSLAATEFPLNIFCTGPTDKSPSISWSGDVIDFVKAMKIKRKYLLEGQTPEGKKEMIAELMPIYQKTKERVIS